MGLLDVLNSIGAGSSDPRAQAASASQGMSPMAKALLALLAIYAMKHMRRADAPSQPAGPAGGSMPGMQGGGLGDLLRGTLGGLLGGPPRERCSTADWAGFSNSCRRAARATLRAHGSAPAPTNRSPRATLSRPSAPIRSTSCQKVAGWIAGICSLG